MNMKLVRDKIPLIISDCGKTCAYHHATRDEYKKFLYEKMHEELNEFIDAPCYEEAADMYEVLRAICKFHDLDMSQVLAEANNKRDIRGGFNNKIILENVNND